VKVIVIVKGGEHIVAFKTRDLSHALVGREGGPKGSHVEGVHSVLDTKDRDLPSSGTCRMHVGGIVLIFI
jgi:hypothetical protein